MTCEEAEDMDRAVYLRQQENREAMMHDPNYEAWLEMVSKESTDAHQNSEVQMDAGTAGAGLSRDAEAA